jgi:hypothetical protein
VVAKMSNRGNAAHSPITPCARIEIPSALRKRNIFSFRVKWPRVGAVLVAVDAVAIKQRFTVMKKTLSKILPFLLAGILQMAPLLRTVLIQARELAPCAWGVVLRIGAGAIGLFGFDAVSSASSIAISPVTATNGVSYIGTITYSGSHAGSVSSMMLSNVCMSSQLSFLQGLKISYAGVNKATVSGTPTNSGTFPFTLKIWDGICSGLTDTRTTSIIIAPTNAALASPSFTSPPQSVTSQEGSDVLFSAGAYGNPTPTYTWYQGIPTPANQIGTGSSLNRSTVALNNAGVYTVVAANSQGTSTASAYLTVCQTAGSDPLAFHYTNYFVVSNALTLRSYMTNFPTATNTYKWQYNYGDINSFTTSGSNLTLAANQIYAAHSGIYSVVFNSVLPGGNNIVNQQEYDSYWAFGTPPAITSSPTGVTTNSGNNVVLTVSASVQQNPYGSSLSQGYNWYKNGSPIFSQNIAGTNVNTSYTINGATSADSGTYTVVVTNFWGSTTSAPAVVTISSPPTVTSQPVSKAVLIGQNASFSIAASGAPLTYQWNKNNSQLSDDSVYSGTHSSSLSLTSVTANEAGSYTATVSNASGSTNSNPATLSVAAPPQLSLGSGGASLNATTVAGLTYIIQSTADLAAPIQWQPVFTNVTDASGLLSYTNTPSSGQQFLRVKFP